MLRSAYREITEHGYQPANPLELVRKERELSTEDWIDVFQQAAKMGVLHVHLSGGEPASPALTGTLRPVLVDRDNLDDVIRSLAPSVDLPTGECTNCAA